ncbi:MAG: TetR/AcrR family transcriptional regulator [Candidatus Dadabacteria bacterium]|nr:MAG: TetR/AcrR family transcriptional regulator [Candidatus Dadabacteria bacterium]
MAATEKSARAASAAEGEARQNTADRILDAAEQLFAEKGFAGTAVRDIAARVGLNPASLYNHFPGKQELYEAVLDRGLKPIIDLLAELSGSDWSPARDELAIDRIVDTLVSKPYLARLIHHEALTGGENLTRIVGRYVEPLYSRGLEALARSPAVEDWSPEELPLLVIAMHNLLLGYFSIVPLLERVLGVDPLSPAAIEGLKRFLRKATQRMIGPTDGSGRAGNR